MKTFARALTYVLAALAGAGVCLVAVQWSRSYRFDSNWRELSKPESGELSYSMESMMADLPAPTITSRKAQAKFLDEGGSSVRLGYKISVVTSPLDKSKIPPEYLISKPVDVGDGKSITQLPVEQSLHEVQFTFVLEDADGFKLMELKSELHDLWSGKSVDFQGIATPEVPRSIAARAQNITYSIHYEKCTNCN